MKNTHCDGHKAPDAGYLFSQRDVHCMAKALAVSDVNHKMQSPRSPYNNKTGVFDQAMQKEYSRSPSTQKKTKGPGYGSIPHAPKFTWVPDWFEADVHKVPEIDLV